ncbi:1-acyl-sn-glycerol-3-phosphate acyltransferase [Nocardioides marmoriginsengisoli]|uniref:1-acyl-sn-glycerol-3-phosphate acyltransferase n=1 Tax=Nocardioides marmoriginsengisoli TaxID=661483 RepID=A0A3N0CBB6_9ACTN|nr:lysophospholipid acyltransferase family protein [Nocardioides marmoriginsengisoli]RNL60744.1 1-acyl-sn-glycerol-3-phosphate acyltransferase [Nocardioides marmoriginsengisoli]
MRDLSYPVVIAAAKTWFKVGAIDIRMTGIENIPEKGGALLAVNHLSFVDYVMAGFPGVERGRLTRFMAKKEIFDHAIGGPVMRSFHHIAIDRGAGQQGMAKAREYLDAGELVGIFPEGTISQSFELQPLKTGAVRIAADAGVPLVPIVVWGTQRFLTKGKPRDFKRHKTVGIEVGEPLHPKPEDNANQVTAELQTRMQAMLDRLIRSHPQEEQPPGSWWLPASYGGSAPTPEEAAAMYAEERRLRAERKAAKKRKSS